MSIKAVRDYTNCMAGMYEFNWNKNGMTDTFRINLLPNGICSIYD